MKDKDTENKTAQFRIRLTPSEKAIVEKNASEAGVTMSEYLRRRVLGHRVMSRADEKTINELRRIGGLLKQTHNVTDGVFSRETAAALREITDAIKRIAVRGDESGGEA